MPTVDGEQHEITFRVAVIGGASERFLSPLNLTDGELSLSEIQGYKPRFAFDVFPTNPWEESSTGGELEGLIPYLDGMVLTDAFSEGTHYSSPALEKLRHALLPGKLAVPTAIFGGSALAEEWRTLTGVPEVIHVEPDPEQAVNVVKAMMKVLLRSSMRSQPPPPVK